MSGSPREPIGEPPHRQGTTLVPPAGSRGKALTVLTLHNTNEGVCPGVGSAGSGIDSGGL